MAAAAAAGLAGTAAGTHPAARGVPCELLHKMNRLTGQVVQVLGEAVQINLTQYQI